MGGFLEGRQLVLTAEDERRRFDAGGKGTQISGAKSLAGQRVALTGGLREPIAHIAHCRRVISGEAFSEPDF